jgi:hypothetical protein
LSDTLRPVRPRRGRPRKFAAPSRAVTLTLPEHIIEALESVDADVSRAIVRLVPPRLAKRAHPPADVVRFGRRGVIVVNPTPSLERRTGVMLVPLPDGRAIIAFDRQITPARLELLIQDALDQHDLSEADAGIFQSIRALLKDARRSGAVRLEQKNIIVLEHAARRAAAPASIDERTSSEDSDDRGTLPDVRGRRRRTRSRAKHPHRR